MSPVRTTKASLSEQRQPPPPPPPPDQDQSMSVCLNGVCVWIWMKDSICFDERDQCTDFDQERRLLLTSDLFRKACHAACVVHMVHIRGYGPILGSMSQHK